MHALCTEVPRLVTEDVPIYLGLVADMFPQQSLPKVSDDILKTTLDEVLRQEQLQPLPSFVEKGMQLYQTQLLRHGILLVRNFSNPVTENNFGPPSTMWKDVEDNVSLFNTLSTVREGGSTRGRQNKPSP